MKYRAILLFIIIFTISFSDLNGKNIFNLKGFEYEKKIDLMSGNNKEIKWFQSVKFPDEIAFFYTTVTGLYLARFNPSNNTIKENNKLMDISNPYGINILKNGKSVFVSELNKGKIYLYKINLNNSTLVLSYDINNWFYYNTFFTSGKFYLLYPFFSIDKFIIRFSEFDPAENFKLLKNIDIIPDYPDIKGIFFPRIIKKKNQIILFYVTRHYNQKTLTINDSIFRTEASSLEELVLKKPNRLDIAGISDYAPEYFFFEKNAYILFLSRAKAVYNIKLFDFKNNTEITLGSKYLNSYDLNYFIANNRMELFYRVYRKDGIYLANLSLDLNKISDKVYISNLKEKRITETGLNIGGYCLTTVSDNIYLFFTADNNLYYTQKDYLCLTPVIQQTRTINNIKKTIFPVFTWSEPLDPSDISGYGYLINQDPTAIPGIINLEKSERYVSSEFLGIGNYYFHILAVDSLNNSSPPLHMPFSIKKLIIPKKNPRPVVSRKKTPPPVAKSIVETTNYIAYFNSFEKYKTQIRSALKDVSNNQFYSAKTKLNLSSIIEPDRFEAVLVAELINAKEMNFFRDFNLGARFLVFSSIWFLLFFFLLRLTRE